MKVQTLEMLAQLKLFLLEDQKKNKIKKTPNTETNDLSELGDAEIMQIFDGFFTIFFFFFLNFFFFRLHECQ